MDKTKLRSPNLWLGLLGATGLIWQVFDPNLDMNKYNYLANVVFMGLTAMGIITNHSQPKNPTINIISQTGLPAPVQPNIVGEMYKQMNGESKNENSAE